MVLVYVLFVLIPCSSFNWESVWRVDRASIITPVLHTSYFWATSWSFILCMFTINILTPFSRESGSTVHSLHSRSWSAPSPYGEAPRSLSASWCHHAPPPRSMPWCCGGSPCAPRAGTSSARPCWARPSGTTDWNRLLSHIWWPTTWTTVLVEDVPQRALVVSAQDPASGVRGFLLTGLQEHAQHTPTWREWVGLVAIYNICNTIE